MFRSSLVACVVLCSCTLQEFSSRGKGCALDGTCPDELVCVEGYCDYAPLYSSEDGGDDVLPPRPRDGGSPPRPTDGGSKPFDGGTPETDAGMPNMDAGQPVVDAGTPVDPCLSCTAAQICFNKVCLNEADIVGRACNSANVCPNGFFCTGEICVKNGGKFCSSLRSKPQNCLDFDSSPAIDSSWETLSRPSGQASVKVETDRPNSPPALMTTSMSPQSGEQPEARLRRAVPGNWSQVEVSFDFRPKQADRLPQDNSFISMVELLCLDGNNTQEYFQGAWIHYYPGSTSNVANFVVPANQSANNLYKALPGQPSTTGFTRVKLEAKRNTNSATLETSVSFNGVRQAQHTTSLCVGEWRVQIGASGRGANATFQYDNVVYRVQ
jgi:hypothetical protein